MNYKKLRVFGDTFVNVYDNGDIETLDYYFYESTGARRHHKSRILKPAIDRYGYKRVLIAQDGIRKSYYVHRLVAMAYIPNPENKPTINHIDGNKINNCVENLEWATQKEQKRHAITHNLCDKNIIALAQHNKNVSIKIKFENVIYNSVREASRKTGHAQHYIKERGELV